jgi:hypothetical protein
MGMVGFLSWLGSFLNWGLLMNRARACFLALARLMEDVRGGGGPTDRQKEGQKEGGGTT